MSGRHVLVVQSFDPDDDTDLFDIEHLDDCPKVDLDDHAWEYGCAVGFLVGEYGYGEYFRHADDPDPFDEYLPAVTVGRHLIEAWHEKHGGHVSPVEWSSGVRLVADEPRPVDAPAPRPAVRTGSFAAPGGPTELADGEG